MEGIDGSAFEKDNPELRKKAKELEDTVVTNALALDGTSSGEHGVGVHKIVPSLAPTFHPSITPPTHALTHPPT